MEKVAIVASIPLISLDYGRILDEMTNPKIAERFF
jgi:hypothetical protein